MAAGRSAERGLTDEELQAIRAGLDAGRKPKVEFTAAAGQIAGQLGQVVALGDPATDEWVVVRFGRDELPFSPTDLRLAPRGAAGRRARPAPAATPEPEFVIDKPVPPRSPAAPTPPSPPGPPDPPVPAPARPAKGRARPKAPAGLTVTLSYTEGEWMVAATQGSRALAKPYVVRPAEALKIVGLVDVPGVREAVEQILAAERAEAEQQAQKLRAELAEIEARLAELREAG